MEQNKVTIDLTEYNEFVISQYENGKIKTSLLDQIKTARKELASLKDEITVQKEVNRDYTPKKELILELFFRRDRMGSDDRREQTDMTDEYIGNYAGFRKNKIDDVKAFNISLKEMLNYINKQWDIRDEQQRIKKLETEAKAKAEALKTPEDSNES